MQVYPGEMVAVLGRHGAGKSTLMHTLGGLQRPDSGQVIIDDVDITQLDEEQLVQVRCQKVGFLFQAFNILPDQTALENAQILLREQGYAREEYLPRAQKALELVGLQDRAARRLCELTSLQRHCVTIARALTQEPAILFADEPTHVLGSTEREVLMGMLQKINDQGMTMIIATLDSGISRYCRRVIKIADGKAVSDELVAKRRIVPPDKIPGPSPDSYVYETPDERGEPVEEEVCPRCNFGSPKGSEICQRCGFTTQLTEGDELSIKDRLTGAGSLGVESTSDEGDVPASDLVMELKEVPFFAELGSNSLVKLIPALQAVSYPKGAQIVKQGDVGDSFYIIKSGNVGVLLERPGKSSIAIAKLGANEGFGEMALLTDETRSATVTALTDVATWRLEKDAFREILSENISLTMYFSRLLTQRLRSLQEKIVT